MTGFFRMEEARIVGLLLGVGLGEQPIAVVATEDPTTMSISVWRPPPRGTQWNEWRNCRPDQKERTPALLVGGSLFFGDRDLVGPKDRDEGLLGLPGSSWRPRS